MKTRVRVFIFRITMGPRQHRAVHNETLSVVAVGVNNP